MRHQALIIGVALLVAVHGLQANGQVPRKKFTANEFDSAAYVSWAFNKKIPGEFRAQALIALSYYPELEEVNIVFRQRKRVTPLSTRPRIWSTFRKRKNRAYVITISEKSNKKLSPILLSRLPYNAQVGVFGHELGHVTDFEKKSSWQLLGLLFKKISPRFVDRFEYNTDVTCINHGLGYQLHDWSAYVRLALEIDEWKGAAAYFSEDGEDQKRQRYINPETIEKYISANKMYKDIY